MRPIRSPLALKSSSISHAVVNDATPDAGEADESPPDDIDADLGHQRIDAAPAKVGKTVEAARGNLPAAVSAGCPDAAAKTDAHVVRAIGRLLGAGDAEGAQRNHGEDDEKCGG